MIEPGRREIVYYALATTRGDFAATAPRAEEMYAPETFGRGVAERLVVETSAETSPARPEPPRERPPVAPTNSPSMMMLGEVHTVTALRTSPSART